MPTLQPIDSYDKAANLRREHFVSQHPYPFLVHATGELHGLDPEKRDDLTSDRLVLERPRQALHESMQVAPVVPRELDKDRVTIGVSTACDVLLDDASVSKRHAYFQEIGGLWHICDADSSAGTQVNNEPLEPGTPRVLVSGDRITLGYVEMMFLAPEGFYDLIRGLFANEGSRVRSG